MFVGKIRPVLKFLQTFTDCNILIYSLMTRETLLERLSSSANGFCFFALTVRTTSGVASLLHLFLSTYFPIPHTCSALCWCFSKKKNLKRSALFWGFTHCRIVVYCRRFGTTYQSLFKGQAVQKKILEVLDP